MLIEIRDKASSFVAYIIIGLLILSFALWGIQEYFGGGGAPTVADINGTEITLPEFNNQFQQRKRDLQSALGANYERQFPNESIVKEQVIGSMINTELLRQEVASAGYQISDASLITRIAQIPQFQTEGKFDPQLYERLLQVQRYSKAQFESDLREQDKLRQFETSLAATSFMPAADLQKFQKLSEQLREFTYALVKSNPDAVSISNEEIENYYNENKQLFLTTEQVKLAYIELKEEELVNQITVTADDAHAIYDSQPERYMTDELRKTRHILFRVSNEVSADALEWDEAQEKADNVIKQLNEGDSFAELAKQHSDDSLSAEKGGEIGFIAAGDFTSTELEEALFDLEVGEYSNPVRTEQGIQIVKLDEIQPSEQKSFEDVREQIIIERKGQIAQTQFIEIADELANLMVEQPDDLQEASETFDLKIKQTGLLGPTSKTELFEYPKIQTLAFSEDILEEGLNSELIEVADGHVIAFRVLEHKKAEQKPLDEVSEGISKFMAVRKAAEHATKIGKELFAKMQAGGTLKDISHEHALELVNHGAVRRDDNQVPYIIMEHAFKLPRPVDSAVTIDEAALPDGNFALIELHKVVDGSDQLDEAQTTQLSQRVNYGRREFNASMETIKESANVQVFQENL
ncbi:MAG: SurA N-terminal domain-containing protein [Gammaproteobacteria bacterium]